MFASVPGGLHSNVESLVFTLRLLLLYCGYAFLALLYTITALAVDWLLPLTGRMRIVKFYTNVFLSWVRLCVNIKVTISGLQHLEPGCNYVIAANHQSALETLYLQTLINPTCTILKKELLWLPFFGWVLFLIKPIALNRAQRLRALKVILRTGSARLAAGHSILIFPQGTRVAPGAIGKWNKAAALLASTSKTAILPIAHNSGEHWGKGWGKTPGTIEFVIGAPISADNTEVMHQQLLTFMQTQLGTGAAS